MIKYIFLIALLIVKCSGEIHEDFELSYYKNVTEVKMICCLPRFIPFRKINKIKMDENEEIKYMSDYQKTVTIEKEELPLV